ncbi:sigma-54 interacting transcriptional regulator [Thermosediminibacter litoriperuensis]|uniref:Sigma-54 interacting transcriptional regulator n=1 Tax=Thermosediminibacter litoriperuensis TaxID=291989 RepID=A0A5S5AR99_9FIRM|nr:sigma-54 interacting transcriptional regulator [Thermosediminibacter litoriperuensis]
MEELLAEDLGLEKIKKECETYIFLRASGYDVFSPPCSEKCPIAKECPYDLVISFQLNKENFSLGLPKDKTLKVLPATIVKLLFVAYEKSLILEEKTNDISLVENALKFLANQLNMEFLLFDKSERLLLSQCISPYQLPFSEGREKLNISSDPEGITKTALGNYYYHKFIRNGDTEGILLWRTKSIKKKENDAQKIKDHYFALVGKNPHFVEIKRLLRQIAETDHTVLLQGESGTGKELFARYIHNLSSRKDNPFIAINCAAIPENLLESELFGYEDGSFTGARRGGKPGKFELADGGTIFLDEIGDMPLPLQAKLLRVLEDRRVERIGAMALRPVDIRVVAATNKNLKELIDKKMFREDLFFRLNVFPINIPPLRERRDDILLLLDFYLKNICLEQDKCFKVFSPEAFEILQNYNWPGNIRELKNVVTYAASICKEDVISPQYLPKYLQNGMPPEIPTIDDSKGEFLTSDEDKLKNQLEIMLEKYGRSTHAKKTIACEMGISLATLYRWLKKYKLK